MLLDPHQYNRLSDKNHIIYNLTLNLMKKFFMSMALLSMTALLLTACGQKAEEGTEETTAPAAEEATLEPAVPAEEAIVIDGEVDADGAVEVTEEAPAE